MASSSNVTNLGEFYMEKGRAEVRDALRVWLEAVKVELEKNYPADKEERAELDRMPELDPGKAVTIAEVRGGIGIVTVILESMAEKPVA